MIVVDTNVIAYLLVGEEEAGAAERLAHLEPEWAVPVLWRSELRNVLTTATRTGKFTFSEARAFMEVAERRLRHRERVVTSASVFDFAAESKLSAYDCEFVALADELQVPLITADRRVVRAFPRIARLLSEFVPA